jgi:FixJ family two-component response regulator
MSNNTVFIVDDDASVRKSVSRLLQAAGYQAQTFEGAKEFLDQLSPAAEGCVIVDLHMPEVSGLELQQALGRHANPLPVIFLTGEGDIPSSVKAMRQGAEDFLTKMAPKDQLLAAVERALARAVKERQHRDRQQELRNRFAALSKREMEVLLHVVQGKLNKQIAESLAINERTVKLHRTSVTRKLGVPSVAELTRLTKEAGLLDEP